jgi:uncharacterized repeat protein (TIGR01451 family)
MLAIAKSEPVNNDADGSGSISVGDTLTYVITATNTGTVSQTNVVVTDVLIDPTSETCVSLAPGADCVLTGTLLVTQAQIDSGNIENEASVSSDALPGPLSDSVNTPIAQTRALSIDKRTLTPDYSAIGDTLSYEFDVTNLGNVTITTPITVDDRISN